MVVKQLDNNFKGNSLIALKQLNFNITFETYFEIIKQAILEILFIAAFNFIILSFMSQLHFNYCFILQPFLKFNYLDYILIYDNTLNF